jgi:hypothetical protein
MRDGVTAGVLGTMVVTAWIIGTGALAGRPLDTPAQLGAGLLGAVADGAHGRAAGATAYFALLYACCTAIALALALVVHRSDRDPSILIGGALAFILFQFAVVGITDILAQSRLGSIVWVQFLGGNALAAVTTATSLYRSHPTVRGQFAHAAED